MGYGSRPQYIVGNSELSARKAKGIPNYHTLLIDFVLPEWKNFPDRTKSFIVSTQSRGASVYGHVYRVWPVGDPLLAICPNQDFWDSFTMRTSGPSPQNFGGLFQALNRVLKTKFADNLSALETGISEVDKDWPLITRWEKMTYPIDHEEMGNSYQYGEVANLIFEYTGQKCSKHTSFFNLLRVAWNPEKAGFQTVRFSELAESNATRNPSLGFSGTYEVWFQGPAYFGKL